MAVIQENRNITGFIELENKGTADIVVVPSTRFGVVLTGRKEDLDRTFTDLHGEKLIVWQDSKNKSSFFGIFGNTSESIGPVTVTIEVPTLREISILGTGKFRCTEAPLVCESMKLSLQGASQIEIAQINCRGNAEFSISGMGDILVSGSVGGTVTASLNGMGNIKGSLSYSSLKKHVLGMGNIQL